MRVRDLSRVDGTIRTDVKRAVRRSQRSLLSRRSRPTRRRPRYTTGDAPNHGAYNANHGGHGAGHGGHGADHCCHGAGHSGHSAEHGGHGAGTAGRRGDA